MTIEELAELTNKDLRKLARRLRRRWRKKAMSVYQIDSDSYFKAFTTVNDELESRGVPRIERGQLTLVSEGS